MNSKKAKRLRREVYGKTSHRTKEYVKHNKTGMIRTVGLRGRYQALKKAIKEGLHSDK